MRQNFLRYVRWVHATEVYQTERTLVTAGILCGLGWQVLNPTTIWLAVPCRFTPGTNCGVRDGRGRNARSQILHSIAKELGTVHKRKDDPAPQNFEQLIFVIQENENHQLIRSTPGFTEAMQMLERAGADT